MPIADLLEDEPDLGARHVQEVLAQLVSGSLQQMSGGEDFDALPSAPVVGFSQFTHLQNHWCSFSCPTVDSILYSIFYFFYILYFIFTSLALRLCFRPAV